MKKTYKHIGYYNNIDDCKTLFTETADDVVMSMKDGFGEFHSVDGEDDTDVTWGDEQDMCLFQKTCDDKYLVRYERGNTKEGWYIDIYELREAEATGDKVEEYCGHCEDYVLLDPELKVQKCPNCGKLIVPCGSLCPMLDDKYSSQRNCSSCPLAKLCEEAEYVGEEYSPEALASFLSTLSDEQLALGVHITVPKVSKDDSTCDEELYLHYNSVYGAFIILDVVQHGKGFTWGSKNLPAYILHDALWNICGREVPLMYVRKDFI